jgi:lysophospholipase L1-like esterase
MDNSQFTNKWRGKTWATFGDSITSVNSYQPIVQQALQLTQVCNFGRSGCSMTVGENLDEGSTYRVGLSLNDRFDNITIFAGTNDFRLNKPLGALREIGDRHDPFTFSGAYQTVVEHLLALHPMCRLNLWTPLQRDKDGYCMHSSNEVGCRLEQYAETVRVIGQMYALPVLDLYSTSGFNKLTLDALTSDRLHPNEAGHQRIAGLAASFMLTL